LVSTSSVDPTQNDRPLLIYEVPPRIELRNALGRVSTWRDGDTVRMTSLDHTAALRGRPWAVLRDGVALFDSVYSAIGTNVSVESAFNFRFALPGIPPLDLRRRTLFDSLAIEESVLNGTRSVERTPRIQVAPGEAITGTVRVRYTTRGRDLLYVMAQAASWGLGVKDTVTVRSLLAGVSGATFSFPVQLRAPDVPGDYWILWTHGTEPSASWLLSSTNWQCKTPIWSDGNDLVTQPDSILRAALAVGTLTVRQRICDETGPFTGRLLPLVGVRVEVGEREKKQR
jgi:hypothetical protein